MLEDRRLLAVLIGGGSGGGGEDLEALNDLDPPLGQSIGGEPTVSIANFRVDDSAGDTQDVFRYRANRSGKLIVETFATTDDIVVDITNGDGESYLEAAQPPESVIALPVVEGELYYVTVTDTTAGGSSTVYSLEFENYAAPVPSGVVLTPESDTGVENDDGVTADDTPTFIVQNDLETFLEVPRADVVVGEIDSEGGVGYDTDLLVTNADTGDVTIVDADRLGDSAAWEVTPMSLPDGDYIVSARTRVISEPGLLVADNAIFVIDISSSTNALFGGDPVGDLNGDGVADTILDAEIAAFLLLNDELIARGAGDTAQVGLVAFSSSSEIIDMDPMAAGVQPTTSPLADTNSNGVGDVEEALRALLSTGLTNFEAGLQDTIAILDDAAIPNGGANVIFLSDGEPTQGGSFDDEVTEIRDNRGHNLRAFGVGPGSNLAVLQTVDPLAQQFSNTNELLGFFGGGGGEGDAVIGFSLLSEPIFITIATGGELVAPAAPDLLASSDTGMLSDDDVTNIREIAITGIGPENGLVDVFAQRIVDGMAQPAELVGEGVIGTDLSDGVPDDEMGLWEVTLEPLADGEYDIFVVVENAAGVRSEDGEPLRVVIDTVAPNTPFLDLTTDTGRSNVDDITMTDLPTVVMRGNATTDGGDMNPTPNDVKFRLYIRPDGSAGAGAGTSEILIYDSFTEFAGFTTMASLERQVSLTLNNSAGDVIPDGVHNFKLEVEDRAGNISHDFLLPFEIDTVVPPVSFGDPAADDDGLVGDSDTSVSADLDTLTDRITSDSTPTLWGMAEANAIVRLYADVDGDGAVTAGDMLLGQTVATPLSGNHAFADGRWEITSAIDLNEPSVFTTRDGLRPLLVTAEDVAGNVNGSADDIDDPLAQLDIFLDTQGPRVDGVFVTGERDYDLFDPKPSTDGPTPLVDALDIDFFDLPLRPAAEAMSKTVSPGGASTDLALDLLEVPDDPVEQLLAAVMAPDSGISVIAASERFVGRLGDGVDPNLAQSATFASLSLTPSGDQPVIDFDGGGIFLTSGVANIPLANTNVKFDFVAAGVPAPDEGTSEDTEDLEAILSAAGQDTTVNNANLLEFEFTVDAGVTSVEADFVFGSDEFPDQFVTDIFAFIVDGTNYAFFPDGSLVSFVQGANADNFNDNVTGAYEFEYDGISNVLHVVGLLDDSIPDGGTHTLKIAIGNTSDQIFDSGVFVGRLLAGMGDDGGIGPGPPPPPPPPVEPTEFFYPAVNEAIADVPGHYLLEGDHVGVIAIESIEFIDNTMPGGPGETTIRLNFFGPFPDDRYTLTVFDSLTDDAGNRLDGESNAIEPQEVPQFPSGDVVPGGEFVARFTVDSRPEIGTFVPLNISIDTNGNFVWDPASSQIGDDATNVDLSFTLPVQATGGAIAPGGYGTHDIAFAGKFGISDDGVLSGSGGGGGVIGGVASGFDTLAAYGWSSELAAFRWIVDQNHDGVVSMASEVLTIQPVLIDFDVAGALPVAGEFNNNPDDGDEIGLYNAGQWAFDTNKDFVISEGEVFFNGLLGHPVVGDFDGDNRDDLAVFNNNQLFFNFGNDGLIDTTEQVITWGFPGVLDRPVAADFDQDGIDDIGLWVPRNSSATPRPQAEWYLLLSNDRNATQRVTGSAVTLNHPFTPAPFGNDLYAEFGDELALPIAGNFDPPVAGSTAATAVAMRATTPGDFNYDGRVDDADHGLWRATFGSTTELRADGNGDGRVNAADYAVWRNNRSPTPPMPAFVAASLVVTGDYDGNGRVDLGDQLVWRESFGGHNLAADGNDDGLVSAADYIVWRNQLGNTAAAASAFASFAPSPTGRESRVESRGQIALTPSAATGVTPTDADAVFGFVLLPHDAARQTAAAVVNRIDKSVTDNDLLLVAVTADRLESSSDLEIDQLGTGEPRDDDGAAALDAAFGSLPSYELQPGWNG